MMSFFRHQVKLMTLMLALAVMYTKHKKIVPVMFAIIECNKFPISYFMQMRSVSYRKGNKIRYHLLHRRLKQHVNAFRNRFQTVHELRKSARMNMIFHQIVSLILKHRIDSKFTSFEIMIQIFIFVLYWQVLD